MLPTGGITEVDSTLSTAPIYPDLTYKMLIEEERIIGHTKTKREAMLQACYKILNTPRYEYAIYPPGYGNELLTLIGKPITYCLAEIPRMIREALLFDDRIIDVVDFDLVYHKRDNVACKFSVISIYGKDVLDKEVDY